MSKPEFVRRDNRLTTAPSQGVPRCDTSAFVSLQLEHLAWPCVALRRFLDSNLDLETSGAPNQGGPRRPDTCGEAEAVACQH